MQTKKINMIENEIIDYYNKNGIPQDNCFDKLPCGCYAANVFAFLISKSSDSLSLTSSLQEIKDKEKKGRNNKKADLFNSQLNWLSEYYQTNKKIPIKNGELRFPDDLGGTDVYATFVTCIRYPHYKGKKFSEAQIKLAKTTLPVLTDSSLNKKEKKNMIPVMDECMEIYNEKYNAFVYGKGLNKTKLSNIKHNIKSAFNHPEKKQNINILQLYYPVLILPEYKALYDYIFEKFSDDDMNKLDLLLKKTA